MTSTTRHPGQAQRRVGRCLLGLAAFTLAATFAVDRLFGEEVTLLARVRPPEERAAWREQVLDPRDDPAEIYGIVEPPPGLRVLVWDDDRLIVPPEAPERRLLPLDRAGGDDVLTIRALWGRALLVAATVALPGLLLLLLGLRRRALARRGALEAPQG